MRKPTAYAFQLDSIQNNFVYFRTISRWSSFGSHGRDIRFADPVIATNFETMIEMLGDSLTWVNNDEALNDWCIEYDGWMLAPPRFTEKRLIPLLGDRECLRSPLGLFWDRDIPRNRASNHRTTRHREVVLQRDSHQCVLCGDVESVSVELTMDHVIPFSRGGETTIDNLVTLCKKCNNAFGNDPHPHLFGLAGLHHGWAPALVKTTDWNIDVSTYARMISQNVLVTRCRTDAAPWLSDATQEKRA